MSIVKIDPVAGVREVTALWVGVLAVDEVTVPAAGLSLDDPPLLNTITATITARMTAPMSPGSR